MSKQYIVLAILILVNMTGCKECEPGEIRTCDFPYEPCSRAEQECLEDGTWDDCFCVTSGCEPDGCTEIGIFQDCTASALPDGCCVGEQECIMYATYCGRWSECECTVWCDAFEDADVLVDMPVDILDVSDTPDLSELDIIDAAEVEDEDEGGEIAVE